MPRGGHVYTRDQTFNKYRSLRIHRSYSVCASGGFGFLRFENGAGAIYTVGPNTELDKPNPPLIFESEYTEMHGVASRATDSRNSISSGLPPYEGQFGKPMWSEQKGTNIDGLVHIGPVTLSDTLGAAGEFKRSGSPAFARFRTSSTVSLLQISKIAQPTCRSTGQRATTFILKGRR